MSIMRVGELERQYVLDVLDLQFKSSASAKYMQKLEHAFANRFGMRYAISCVNGTATMHATLEALGIGVGDEVIVPPLTMSATTFAVLQCGATPIFADVDADTFQIDVSSIALRISKSTKAIITVALYGMCPDMNPILDLCRRHDLRLIEDNAENFLGEYGGRLVGTFGDAASFSFQSSKHLTSGEGGIILTNDEALATSIRRVNSLGYAGVGASKAKITKKDIQSPTYDRHVSMGWNYRMPELCCAVALAQVERIDELVGYRVAAAKLFDEVVRSHSLLKPQHTPDNCKHSYWTYVAKNVSGISWYEIRDRFVANGGHGFYSAWKLTYQEPMIKNMKLLQRDRFLTDAALTNYMDGSCPVAETIQKQIMQFKTNYWDYFEAEQQAEILDLTLKSFA